MALANVLVEQTVITALEVLLWIAGATMLLPATVFFVECLFGVLPTSSSSKSGDPSKRPRSVIVIPAHDEEGGLGETLSFLKSELDENTSILTVADNCSDDTAAVAEAAGVDVIERHDPERRGKGYALAFAFEHLAARPPDVVVIVDADCEVSPRSVAHLTEQAATTGRPVQAEYLMTLPPDPSPLSRVSAFAFKVRNRVRPRGLHKLGLPCHLTGSGMALPWDAVEAAPPTRGYLVEDLLMGIELAYRGFAPKLCPHAHITSRLPSDRSAGRTQRRRWEHGQLTTLLRHAPRLIFGGLVKMRLELIALGLDLFVPPLALFVGLLGMATGAAVVATFFGASWWPLVVLCASSAMVATGVTAAWLRVGLRDLPPRHMLMVPLYILWKVPIYLAFFFKGRHGEWERTKRDHAKEEHREALDERTSSGEQELSERGE